MIEIRINGESLDLPEGFSMQVDDSNPIFNDRGSQSLPATVPVTARNVRLLGAPFRLDAASDPNDPATMADVVCGAYLRRGTINVIGAGREEGISFNIGFDNSTAYAAWESRKLSELSGLPVHEAPEDTYPLDHVLGGLLDVYEGKAGADTFWAELAVFPVAVARETVNDNEDETIYWEMLNVTGEHGLGQPSKVNRVIDGIVTEVTVPAGYGVTPFLRVWRVLELIFADMRLALVGNPFRTDPDLRCLAVLNNCADAVCNGRINYADLMPDCTVGEFLNALWVRFGLVYHVDFSRGTVSLKLFDDILSSSAGMELDALVAGQLKVTYDARKYIKLSAGTSIEGASPACERFEDFTKGVALPDISMGSHVDQLSAAAGSQLGRIYLSNMWHRIDTANATVKSSSTSFFDWDPQPEGYEAHELKSVDEFVPVDRVSNVGTGAGNWINEYCPLYLCCSRHRHSYIKGIETENQDGESTPLAFMLAYTVGGKSYGRLSPEGDDGQTVAPDDGSSPSLSLLFQFRDGLFARYWRRYDELLRHGNRYAEVKMMMSKPDLYRLDMSQPVNLHGVRCLIDTVSYLLPAGNEVQVQVKLRPIQSQGFYDIDSEQHIPDISAGSRHLIYGLLSDSFGLGLGTRSSERRKAAEAYIGMTGYEPHGVQGDLYCVDYRSARAVNIERIPPTWQTDPTLPTPVAEGWQVTRKYRARLTYEIYEVHDMSEDVGDSDNWVLGDLPIGHVTLETTYDVTLETRWE